MKKALLRAVSVAALVGMGTLASAGAASAYVVCNNTGDCWHTDQRHHYDRRLGAQYHPDDWYFHQTWSGDNHYRDYHEGRGGYRNGIWFSL